MSGLDDKVSGRIGLVEKIHVGVWRQTSLNWGGEGRGEGRGENRKTAVNIKKEYSIPFTAEPLIKDIATNRKDL